MRQEKLLFSASTLKRKLAIEGTNFQETHNNWRFETAIDSLKNLNLMVKEISENSVILMMLILFALLQDGQIHHLFNIEK